MSHIDIGKKSPDRDSSRFKDPGAERATGPVWLEKSKRGESVRDGSEGLRAKGWNILCQAHGETSVSMN